VNFMRDRMGLPIEYDREKFGFRYTRAVTGFPSAGLVTPKPRRAEPHRLVPAPMEGGGKAAPPAGNARVHPVRIRFDTDAASTIRGNAWFAMQDIQNLPGGGIDICLRSGEDADIVRWVLGWGSHAWVMEPEWLRLRVRAIAREIVARH
jgi:hypothetical protein